MVEMVEITESSIKSMSVMVFINYLSEIITLSPNDIITLYKEDIDGEAFLLMQKSHLSELGLLDRYVPLCNSFPTANFIDDFFD